MHRAIVCLALLLLICPFTRGAEPPTWELKDGGRWVPSTAPTTAPITDETLDRVEEMLSNKQSEAAHKIIVAWLKAHRGSPIWDRGLFLVAQANFQRGDRIGAFYNLDELMDKYPESRFYMPALERQYEIADQYLKGYKRRELGIFMIGATTEATEMLYRIQQRAPGSELAEKALLRVADYYYSDAQFDVAADAYGAYIRAYPRSPYLARVKLRQAFSTLAQFRGVKFDATNVIDARQQLLDLAAIYPRVADEENVTALVRRIDEAFAKKLLVTAHFYRRTHKPQASVYYYRYLIQTYSDFPEAQEARREMAKLPAWAINPPAPPTGENPATRPVPTPPATRPTTGPKAESR